MRTAELPGGSWGWSQASKIAKGKSLMEYEVDQFLMIPLKLIKTRGSSGLRSWAVASRKVTRIVIKWMYWRRAGSVGGLRS